MEKNEQEQQVDTTKRDLGSVGGGTVPNKGTSTGSTILDDESVTTSSADTNDGGEASAMTSDKQPETHDRGNIGGRNPGQVRGSSGDQDSTRGKRSGIDPHDEVADPMTSRAPGQIAQEG